MFSRKLRTKLPETEQLANSCIDEDVRDPNFMAQYQTKLYTDQKRGAKESK